jgi:hypothetical protein
MRFLAESLRRVDAATAAAHWHDDALGLVLADARAEVKSVEGAFADDIAAAAASAPWRERALDYARGATATRALTVAPEQATANAVVAVALARAAIAEAILIRLVITLGISLSLVSFYHFSGWTRYDDVSRLSLYLFSAVVGSVVCTNALCFEAQRVRDAMSRGERIWQILVAKNLAMAVLVTVAALPVIAFLTAANEDNPIAMVDQLITMVFIWLGVGKRALGAVSDSARTRFGATA